MSSLRFLDFPPHIQSNIWMHDHASSPFAHLPFPYLKQRASHVPAAIFHPFRHLTLELRAYISKLAILCNTTYNIAHRRWPHQSKPIREILHQLCLIYFEYKALLPHRFPHFLYCQPF